ncbi:MAG: metallophosphoesterase [Roseibium sp.]|uniref:metallophosphoesterase n=1 Tax=Roseibium sp. TaxID=1936156 RepID=UPI00329956C5
MAHFYTADPHFGHAKIIPLCNRPFKNLDEMNAALLDNLKQSMTKRDDLWVIGDFAYKGSGNAIEKIFSEIPGNKHLIIGNHDCKHIKRLNWGSQHEIFALNDGPHRFLMCHYPMVSWNQARHGVIQLFGHVHNNWAGSRNSVNLGVDLWDFAPVKADAIKARAKTLPVNPIWDLVEPNADLGA